VDDTYEGRKPMNGQLEKTTGRPRNVWLNKVQEDANGIPLSTLWKSEIASGHGATQPSTRTTRDEDEDDIYPEVLTTATATQHRITKYYLKTSQYVGMSPT